LPKKVRFSLNIQGVFGIITIAIEMADSGEPQVLVSADTQKKQYLSIKDDFLNILDYK